MKPLILILLLVMPIFAQSPLLELHDNKIPGRKLIVFADHRYQFFPFPGTRPFEGVAVLDKGKECDVKFTSSQNAHTVTVAANRCNWTGTARLQGFIGGLPVDLLLNDTIQNQPPRK